MVYKNDIFYIELVLGGSINAFTYIVDKHKDDVFKLKQLILLRLVAIVRKSNHIDALQKTLKTLTELEKDIKPDDNTPGLHANTVNMFAFFNEQLEKNGYKGQPLTDADIVEGDD